MKSRKFKVAICVLVVTVAFAVCWAEAAEQVQYKLKFEKGKKYYVRMVVENKITQTNQGQEQAAERTTGFGYDFDIDEVDENGDAWISCTYRWVNVRVKGSRGEMAYDSSKKKYPPAMEGYAALLGERFYLKMTTRGRIERVNGLDAMHSYIKGKLPEGPGKRAMLNGLKNQINEEVIKESFKNFMVVYPEKAVGVGDSWNETVVVSQGIPMIMERTLKLKERKGGVAIIQSSSVIRPNLEVKPLQIGAARMSYNVSGKQHGQIELQESTGLIIRSELNQEVSGEGRIREALGGDVEQKSVPIKVQSVATFEMTERKEQSLQ